MNNTEAGRHRRKKFLFAFTASPLDSELEDLMPHAPMEEIKDVVFVVHGIRDEAYWTKKIAREIKRQGREKNRIIQTRTGKAGK